MAKKKAELPPDDPDAQRRLLRPTRLVGKHKGKIPAAVIRAAVKKLAEERRKNSGSADRSAKSAG